MKKTRFSPEKLKKYGSKTQPIGGKVPPITSLKLPKKPCYLGLLPFLTFLNTQIDNRRFRKWRESTLHWQAHPQRCSHKERWNILRQESAHGELQQAYNTSSRGSGAAQPQHVSTFGHSSNIYCTWIFKYHLKTTICRLVFSFSTATRTKTGASGIYYSLPTVTDDQEDGKSHISIERCGHY